MLAVLLCDKLKITNESMVWFRVELGEYTANSVECISFDRLLDEAQSYIEKNTTPVTVPDELLDIFITAYVLSDDDAADLIGKRDFNQYESAAGYCPKCGSTSISYDSAKVGDNDVAFPWRCSDCDSDGEELGRIVFTGHKVDSSPYFELDSVNPSSLGMYKVQMLVEGTKGDAELLEKSLAQLVCERFELESAFGVEITLDTGE